MSALEDYNNVAHSDGFLLATYPPYTWKEFRDLADAAIAELEAEVRNYEEGGDANYGWLRAMLRDVEAELAVYKKDDLDATPLAEAVVRLEAENEWLRSLLPDLLPQTGQHRAVADSTAPVSGPETEPERP